MSNWIYKTILGFPMKSVAGKTDVLLTEQKSIKLFW